MKKYMNKVKIVDIVILLYLKSLFWLLLYSDLLGIWLVAVK